MYAILSENRTIFPSMVAGFSGRSVGLTFRRGLSLVRFPNPLSPFFFQDLHHPDALLIVGEAVLADLIQYVITPACPKGVWPRSCPKAIASVRDSFIRSAFAIVLAIWDTSNVWVSLVR